MSYESSLHRALYPQDRLLNKKHRLDQVKCPFHFLKFQLLQHPLKNEFKNEIRVKVRSTGKLLRAKVKVNLDKAEVNILDGESGISPGQACVF